MAFHRLSSSRLMPGWMFPPELMAAAGVRMIGVDRPGYALSTVPWATGFPDWPRAVTALADGLGRFAVVAHSLGSAFALACGPALHDRLAVIVIASGMGPLQPGEQFHSGSRADNVYWRLACRQATGRHWPASGRAPSPRPSGRCGARPKTLYRRQVWPSGQ